MLLWRMSNGRRINRRLWIQVGIIVSLIIAIVVTLNFKNLSQWLSYPETLDNHNKYLLSATAQVLGAVFAIVFAITPIVVQQLSRYISKPFRHVFKKEILLYIAGFAVTIVIPL